MKPTTTRPTIAMVGTGRLARALLPLLHDANYPIVAVAGRRLAAARSAVRRIPGARATTDPLAACDGAELVLLAVSDDALGPLAARLAAAHAAPWRGKTVLHHAGALGTEPLAPLERAGASVGLLHPLQCVGDARVAATTLPGSRARIEGDPRAERMARRLALDLGLRPLRGGSATGPAGRAAYHAAASLVANDLVALLAESMRLMGQAGIAPRDALDGLIHLARGTLSQAESRGLAGALTGPVARGDLQTLSRQLRRIASGSQDAAEAHRRLSLRLVALRRRLGHPPPRGFERALRALPLGGRVGRGPAREV